MKMTDTQSYQRDDNPSSDAASPESVKFLADAMLGRLARWLRAAGYDTAYDPALDDPALLRLARAEGRIVLTADRALAQSRGARVLLVTADDLTRQLAQVLNELGPPPAPAFSRCLACNGALEPADRASLVGLLPHYILNKYTLFSRCPNCQRIYWPGTHWARMRAVLDELAVERTSHLC
jgi:uncharacterized protein with PIN domain